MSRMLTLVQQSKTKKLPESIASEIFKCMHNVEEGYG